MDKYALYETPLGFYKIYYSDNLITGIQSSGLCAEYGEPNNLTDMTFSQLKEYFEGKRKYFDIPLKIKGTPFQKKVWNALLEIPYGETRTYKQIAQNTGNEKACRAVGMANNKNPVAIIIPCHRVIGSNGRLTGYASGLEKKAALLELEKENINT